MNKVAITLQLLADMFVEGNTIDVTVTASPITDNHRLLFCELKGDQLIMYFDDATKGADRVEMKANPPRQDAPPG